MMNPNLFFFELIAISLVAGDSNPPPLPEPAFLLPSQPVILSHQTPTLDASLTLTVPNVAKQIPNHPIKLKVGQTPLTLEIPGNGVRHFRPVSRPKSFSSFQAVFQAQPSFRSLDVLSTRHLDMDARKGIRMQVDAPMSRSSAPSRFEKDISRTHSRSSSQVGSADSAMMVESFGGSFGSSFGSGDDAHGGAFGGRGGRGRGWDSNEGNEYEESLNGGFWSRHRSDKSQGLLQALLAKMSGVIAARVAADPKFVYKLLVAEVMMVTSRLAAELDKRKGNFLNELEFVSSSVGNGIISQFFLVLVLAPTVMAATASKVASATPGGLFRERLAALPAYVFQPGPFSLAERAAGFLYKAFVFGQIGLVSGAGGAAATHAIVNVRQALDKTYELREKLPDIWRTGMNYAIFCAISSTPRYHTVNGIETVLAQHLAPSSKVLSYSILALRWLNNFYGGAQWILWNKWLTVPQADASTAKSSSPKLKRRMGASCTLVPAFPLIAHLSCK